MVNILSLDRHLKRQLGYVENGGAAKECKYFDGLVKVNGEVCTMRGKKLFSGDKVLFEGEEIEIL